MTASTARSPLPTAPCLVGPIPAGEIIPQAVCSRFGIAIGAAVAPAVRVLMLASAPISWPMSWVLHRCLGSENPLFPRQHLKTILSLHSQEAGEQTRGAHALQSGQAEPCRFAGQRTRPAGCGPTASRQETATDRSSTGLGGTLTQDEFAMMGGALELTLKTASQAMTPLSKVFMLSEDAELSEELVDGILASGYSRIPIHRRGAGLCVRVPDSLTACLSSPGHGARPRLPACFNLRPSPPPAPADVRGAAAAGAAAPGAGRGRLVRQVGNPRRA